MNGEERLAAPSDRFAASIADAAVYQYVDEACDVLFEVVRSPDKRFHQRRPDGRGGYINGLGSTRRVLFRLPRVVEHVAANRTEPLFIVEGEKDVLALEAAGGVATCNPMGAGKWNDDYCASLQGARRVLIVADKDEPGRRHALQIRESLARVGVAAEIVQARTGKDASDHLAAGHTLEDFEPVELAEIHRKTSPELGRARRVLATRASEIERRTVAWLDPGRVPLGAVTLLTGVGGLGKSQWTCLLGARVTRGELGGSAGVVLIATAEDDPQTTVRPRLEAVGADLDLVRFLHVETREGEDGIAVPDDVPELEQLAADLDARLLVVDPLVAHLPAEIDSHKDQSVRRALAPLYRLATGRALAVVAVVHLNKTQGLAPLMRVSGSAGFGNAARSVLLLDRDPGDPDGEMGSQRVVAHVKCNVGPEQPSLLYRVAPMVLPAVGALPEVETSRLELLGVSEHTGSALLATIDEETRSAVEDAEGFLRQELGDGAHHLAKEILKAGTENGIPARTLRRARDRIGAKTEKAGFGRGWEWWLPASAAKGPSTKGPTDMAPSQDPPNHAGLEGAQGPEGANIQLWPLRDEMAPSESLPSGTDELVVALASRGVPIDEITAFAHLPAEAVREILSPSYAEAATATRRLQDRNGGDHARPLTEVVAEVARMRRESGDVGDA